ncbi:MAG: hypothetical protein ACWGON_04100, partial [Gemmatimonadota bacterium]
MFLCGLEMVAEGGQELVIVGDPQSEAVKAMLGVSRREYAPHLVTIVRPAGEDPGPIVETSPFLAAFEGEPGSGATAYLCRGLTCERPVTDTAELESLLERDRHDG